MSKARDQAIGQLERKTKRMQLIETPEITVEVFPVETRFLPTLHAYSVEVKGYDSSMIAGKLAYRMKKAFHGHWVWSNNRIVADVDPSPEAMNRLVQGLWSDESETFRHLRGIRLDTSWTSTARTLADFATALVNDYEKDIRTILDRESRDIGNVRVDRLYETRGWVTCGHPSLSVSVFSQLVHKQALKSFVSSLAKPEDLIGLWVSTKTSRLKGEITGIEGRLSEHRSRLLALSQDERNQELIRRAPDDDLVVSLETGRNRYEYVLSALQLIVRVENFSRFGVSPSQVLKVLRIEPSLRNKLVERISNLLREQKIIGQAYKSTENAELFLGPHDFGFDPHLRFGTGEALPYDERSLFRNLSSFGLFRKSPKFENGGPVKLGVINGVAIGKTQQYMLTLRQELEKLGFTSEVLPEVLLESLTRLHIEKAVDMIETEEPDVVLALLPDELVYDEDDWGPYHEFKSLTIGRGLPSQFVHESTLSKRFAVGNVVLGIIGKTGNIPFVLSEPLPYADLVVGIDIARQRKKHLPGSLNATAIARIYFGNGEFLRYVIHDSPLEGESIPDNVLQRLFPANEFKGKRVVIHRDGYFRGDEKSSLLSWAQKIGATFHLVEVIKSGTPRLYGRTEGNVVQPKKGSVFKLSSTEAFLISSPPPFPDATAQPLHVRTVEPFGIEQAIHSVLSLTQLHYGSFRAPRLPVTIHYSDKIAYLALRGIKPKDLEGKVPFWL